MNDTFIDKLQKQQNAFRYLILLCIPFFTSILCFLIFYSLGFPDLISFLKSILVGLISIYALKQYLVPYAIKDKNTAVFIAVFMLSIVLTTTVFYCILEIGIINYPSYLDRSKLPLNLILAVLGCVSIIEFFTACSFYLLYKTCQLSIDMYKNIINAHKTEIKSLHQQYNPYFLYNSLSSLNSIIEAENYEKAQIYNAEISSLLHKQMVHLSTEYISLEEEIIWLKEYLEVEKIRLNNHLSYSVQILDEELYLQHIPPMILQPIVQSIILQQSALRANVQELSIDITIKEASAHGIMITISNNGFVVNRRFVKPINLINTEKKIRLINELNTFKIDFKQDKKVPSTYYELRIEENSVLI
jgi:hypothetical protein